MEASNSDLIGDGISEDFFNFLWMKDELGYGPSVNIPDTIIYKYGQPVVWYFTSSAGKVKKKNKHNLISGKIEDAFTRMSAGYDIVATFASNEVNEAPGSGGGKRKIEFLDAAAFHEFLYTREQNSGILQRFIDPKSNRNEAIRAIWSPKVCLIERAINRHYLHDTGYGLYERCITFEGPEYYIETVPLRGPVLSGQIQKITEAIALHIAEVSFSQYQISRLVLTLKVDSRDKLWVLYSTSARSETAAGMADGAQPKVTSLVNIDSTISLPPTVCLDPEKTYDHEAGRKSKIRCISCAMDCIMSLRHPISYKSVVKHYEHVLQLVVEMSREPDGGRRDHSKKILKWPPEPDVIDAAGGVGFGCLALVSADDPLVTNTKLDLSKSLDHDELRIPPILRYLHPKLTAKSFQRCRNDPLFLYKTVSVCENCYLVYAEFTTMMLRIGSDLTKLLRPDPMAAKAIETATLRRPTSADWRSVSTVQKSAHGGGGSSASGHGLFASTTRHADDGGAEFEKSANHIHAKATAIGLRSSDVRRQPDVPGVVRSGEESSEVIDAYIRSSSPGATGLSGTRVVGSMFPTNRSPQRGAEHEDSIASRERVFFKEVSKNPQMHDQHPLLHLINAEQKLALMDEQSGVFTANGSLHSNSLFGSSYGSVDTHYQKPFVEYKSKMPGPIKKPKVAKLKKMRKSGSQSGDLGASASGTRESVSAEGREANDSGNHNKKSTEGGVMPSNSSAAHKVFLRETLKKVSDNVDSELGGSDDRQTPVEPSLQKFNARGKPLPRISGNAPSTSNSSNGDPGKSTANN
jgi:hypothetical protein